MALELTGERTLPGVVSENYWFRRHEAAYHFAAARCTQRDVLDAGCGEGYGAALLAESARSVTAVELRHEVCAHAGRAYPQAAVVQADVCALPLPEACMDAVVSLQVIEHLWDIPRYLDETVRVLRPGGLLVCSTPNRLTFSPDGQVPDNPFHAVELTADELHALLAPRFAHVEVHGLHHATRLARAEAERDASLPRQLVAGPPDDRPEALARLVASVSAADFTVSAGRPVDASLDLVALARLG